jgi:hypothetical protein
LIATPSWQQVEGGVMAVAAAGRLLLVSFLPNEVAHMVNGFLLFTWTTTVVFEKCHQLRIGIL